MSAQTPVAPCKQEMHPNMVSVLMIYLEVAAGVDMEHT